MIIANNNKLCFWKSCQVWQILKSLTKIIPVILLVWYLYILNFRSLWWWWKLIRWSFVPFRCICNGMGWGRRRDEEIFKLIRLTFYSEMMKSYLWKLLYQRRANKTVKRQDRVGHNEHREKNVHNILCSILKFHLQVVSKID